MCPYSPHHKASGLKLNWQNSQHTLESLDFMINQQNLLLFSLPAAYEDS